MPAITLPADGDKPYGAVLRTAINKINDAVDAVPFLNLNTYAGVDPTGVTECSAAIQAAFDAALAQGLPVVSKQAEYRLSSGVTLNGSADLSRAVFNYTASTGIALTIGAAGGLSRKQIRAPFVIALAKTVAGWGQVAGTIGIRCINLIGCEVTLQDVRAFETGIQAYADVAAYLAYNRFFLTGSILNNKRGFVVATDGSATAFANKNEVFGGDFNYSGEAVASAGTRHILLTESVVPITSWTFHEPSLQDSSGSAEFMVDISGRANVISNAYWETNVGTIKARWANGSYDNIIDFGVNSDLIEETVTGTAENRLNRLGRDKVITANRTLDRTDFGKTLILNAAGAITITLPDVAFLSPGTKVTIRNVAATSASINTTTNTINGSLAALTLPQWGTMKFISQKSPDAQWIREV